MKVNFTIILFSSSFGDIWFWILQPCNLYSTFITREHFINVNVFLCVYEVFKIS